MAKGIAWVAELPETAPEGGNIHLRIHSDTELICNCMLTRGTYRRFIERERRMLNALDLADKDRVVRWKDRKRKH